MIQSVTWFVGMVCLTMIIGPVTLFASQVGQPDRADLYFIVDGGGSPQRAHTLASYGARDVGPMRGRLAKMIHAPPSSREQLLQAGYVMLPASTLAEVCGLSTDYSYQ